MSNLQEKAEPILTAMLQEGSLLPSPQALTTFVRWVLMTSAVIEYADPGTSGLTAEQRREIMVGSDLSSGRLIALARYSGTRFDEGFYHRSFKLGWALAGQIDSSALEPGFLTVFGIGSLLFVVIGGTGRFTQLFGDPSSFCAGNGLLCVWPGLPLKGQAKTYSDSEVEVLIRSFGDEPLLPRLSKVQV